MLTDQDCGRSELGLFFFLVFLFCYVYNVDLGGVSCHFKLEYVLDLCYFNIVLW